LDLLEQLSVGRRCLLFTLIRVVNLWGWMVSQRPLQRARRQDLIQTAPQLLAPDLSGEHIHNYSQVDKLNVEPIVGDIRDPDLVRPYHGQALHQVRIAEKAVLTVRSAAFLAFDGGEKSNSCIKRHRQSWLISQSFRCNCAITRRQPYVGYSATTTLTAATTAVSSCSWPA
jgi:hypothetical protein